MRQDLNHYYEAELLEIKENKTNHAVSDSVINTAFPSSQVPVNTGHRTYQYWTTPRKNTPPTDIHHHYEGELARLKPIFSCYIESYRLNCLQDGVWTSRAYISLHSCRKKIRFYLTLWIPTIPRRRVGIKSIPSNQASCKWIISPRYDISKRRTRIEATPMSRHATEPECLPQSHELSQFLPICYISYGTFVTFGCWKAKRRWRMGLLHLRMVFCTLCQRLVSEDQCQVTGWVYNVSITPLPLSELDFSTKRRQKRKKTVLTLCSFKMKEAQESKWLAPEHYRKHMFNGQKRTGGSSWRRKQRNRGP